MFPYFNFIELRLKFILDFTKLLRFNYSILHKIQSFIIFLNKLFILNYIYYFMKITDYLNTAIQSLKLKYILQDFISLAVNNYLFNNFIYQ